VLQHFTWTRVFTALLERYAAMIGRRSALAAPLPPQPAPAPAAPGHVLTQLSFTSSNTVSLPLRSPTATWRPSGDQRTHEGSESVR
jgi:hypothetical protein